MKKTPLTKRDVDKTVNDMQAVKKDTRVKEVNDFSHYY